MVRDDTPSFSQRLRSMRNELSLGISGCLKFSHGIFTERPCAQLHGLSADQSRRIDGLQKKYTIRFEQGLSQDTSLNNYAYLELMDRAWVGVGADRPAGGTQSDVGCGNFWYAAALQAFFRPYVLKAYEIDAFRRYANGHTRQDFARGYAASWPGTQFVAADYLAVQEKVDRISCWYPLVARAALLAWGLPLKLLNPDRLFTRMAANLNAGGGLLMVNHGLAEAKIAAALCKAAGFVQQWEWLEPDPLRSRPQPPALSYWRH